MIAPAETFDYDLEALLDEHRIVYVGPDRDQRDTFSALLKRQKEERDITWTAFSQLCGVKKLQTYASIGKRGPISPSREDFSSIVAALGLSEDHFLVKGLRAKQVKVPEAGTREYWEAILTLGNWILARTEAIINSGDNDGVQRLSVHAIEQAISSRFQMVHGRTIEDRAKLHQDLLAVPKFRHIELQNQTQDHRSLSGFEDYTLRMSVNMVLAGAEDELGDLPPNGVECIFEYYCARVDACLATECGIKPRRFTRNQILHRWRGIQEERRGKQTYKVREDKPVRLVASPEPNAELPPLEPTKEEVA